MLICEGYEEPMIRKVLRNCALEGHGSKGHCEDPRAEQISLMSQRQLVASMKDVMRMNVYMVLNQERRCAPELFPQVATQIA